jgi:hypothetical protein
LQQVAAAGGNIANLLDLDFGGPEPAASATSPTGTAASPSRAAPAGSSGIDDLLGLVDMGPTASMPAPLSAGGMQSAGWGAPAPQAPVAGLSSLNGLDSLIGGFGGVSLSGTTPMNANPVSGNAAANDVFAGLGGLSGFGSPSASSSSTNNNNSNQGSFI